MRRIIFVSVFSVFLGYLGYVVSGLLIPPSLTITEPGDGVVSKSRTIELHGKTIPDAKVTVNGGAILPTEKGDFSTLLVLGNGVNTIEVKAEKRYSRPRVVTRTVLIQENGKALSELHIPKL